MNKKVLKKKTKTMKSPKMNRWSERPCSVPEVEDPCNEAIQHDGEEQRDDVENGKVDEVDGQVELPFHSVATLHMSVLTDLHVTQLSQRR